MPDWRYNVLSSASKAYIDAKEAPPRDPLAASFPRRADRSRLTHTCPYTTIFIGARSQQAHQRIPTRQIEFADPYADTCSVDRSSNLTDTSSFARYEDCRPQLEDVTIDLQDEDTCSGEMLTDGKVTLQVQKVPYTSSVFYVSARTGSNKEEVEGSDLFVAEGTDSDALSSCTCDSFERCEFDCRDFEPFSDTCCCDPLSDGICTRSPKEVDSPDIFCSHIVEEDRVSARSDMDGLDLNLFEPAAADCDTDNESELPILKCAPVPTALCGVLYALPDTRNDTAPSAGSGAVVGVPPTWEPFYCVLQQDRRILTAYTSEELATNNNNTEYTRSLPRVRLDGGGPVGTASSRLRCWAAPPSISEEQAEEQIEEDAVSLQAVPLGQGMTDSPLCRGCLSAEETAPHVILECVGVAAQRTEILKTPRSLREACGDTRRILRFWSELGWLDY